jgi:hypothetical protein
MMLSGLGWIVHTMDHPQLCDLTPEQLRAQATNYRQAAVTTAPPRLAQTLLRLAACCELLAANRETTAA